MRLVLIKCLPVVMLLSCAIQAHAIGPRDRILPQRQKLPGPNNPIGPNNPAVSNPLSSLNSMNPYSINQTVLRQLLQNAAQQDTQSGNANILPTNILGYATSNGMYQSIPANYRLLLNNRTPFTTSHPVIFERPDPLTPLSNSYAVIGGRYYRISFDPANDKDFYSSFNDFYSNTYKGK